SSFVSLMSQAASPLNRRACAARVALVVDASMPAPLEACIITMGGVTSTRPSVPSAPGTESRGSPLTVTADRSRARVETGRAGPATWKSKSANTPVTCVADGWLTVTETWPGPDGLATTFRPEDGSARTAVSVSAAASYRRVIVALPSTTPLDSDTG